MSSRIKRAVLKSYKRHALKGLINDDIQSIAKLERAAIQLSKKKPYPSKRELYNLGKAIRRQIGILQRISQSPNRRKRGSGIHSGAWAHVNNAIRNLEEASLYIGDAINDWDKVMARGGDQSWTLKRIARPITRAKKDLYRAKEQR